LEALIPKREKPVLTSGYTYINIDQLIPSPYQSRIDISEAELKELSASIKSQGVIQPVIVRKKGDKYEIIAGSRRFYASKLLGLKELPAVIRSLDDKNTLIFSIIENLQRQDLTPLEEAESFKRLEEEFSLSSEETGRLVGKSRSAIVNTLRLLKLPDPVQEALRGRKITASQARTLLSLPTEREQMEMFEHLLRGKVSVRKLETAVRIKRGRAKTKDPFLLEAENGLQKQLGRKVKIISSGKKGRVVIEYYSLEDLDNLIGVLSKAPAVS